MRWRSSPTRYGGTGYAPRAALLSRSCCSTAATRRARRRSCSGSIDRADEDELKQIARYRLAEVLLDEKQYDEALATLDAKHAEPFAGLYADLRGDVLAAAGRSAEARAAYQTALAKLDAEVAVPQLRAGEARRAAAASAARRPSAHRGGRPRGARDAAAPAAPPHAAAANGARKRPRGAAK